MEEERLKSILASLLFAAGEPVSIARLAAARVYAQTERYGFLILLVLLYTHWLDVAIYPVMNMAFNAISWMVQL